MRVVVGVGAIILLVLLLLFASGAMREDDLEVRQNDTQRTVNDVSIDEEDRFDVESGSASPTARYGNAVDNAP